MERIELEAAAADAGMRTDAFLEKKLDGVSRSAVQKLMQKGLVTCEGEAVKKSHVVAPGRKYTVLLPPPEPLKNAPQAIDLDIVWEDADIVAVNKPRGLVVHPAPGHPDGTLVNALLHHCAGNLSGIGGVMRPGIVHRLDKDTSGLMLAAKNDFAHLALSAQLKDRSLSRIYEAVIHGRLKQDAGTIDAPIGRHGADRKRMAVARTGGRPAITHYTVLARYPGFCHVRCKLETGRTHQIRAHMAHIGHPLLGDTVYGRKKPEPGLSGQCLHAKELDFIHPRSGARVHLETELPDDFRAVLRRLERLK